MWDTIHSHCYWSPDQRQLSASTTETKTKAHPQHILPLKPTPSLRVTKSGFKTRPIYHRFTSGCIHLFYSTLWMTDRIQNKKLNFTFAVLHFWQVSVGKCLLSYMKSCLYCLWFVWNNKRSCVSIQSIPPWKDKAHKCVSFRQGWITNLAKEATTLGALIVYCEHWFGNIHLSAIPTYPLCCPSDMVWTGRQSITELLDKDGQPFIQSCLWTVG